jgi:hypothetical protein
MREGNPSHFTSQRYRLPPAFCRIPANGTIEPLSVRSTHVLTVKCCRGNVSDNITAVWGLVFVIVHVEDVGRGEITVN